MIWSGPLLPLVALIAPLCLALLAAVPAVRPHALIVLPFAPLPALALALWGTRGEATTAFDLLLQVRLELDEPTAMFLGAAGLLWSLAGIYATAYLKGTRKPATFAAFWCLTLAGNLGVFLAGDAVTFYASFTAVSLPAYILIVHEATGKALRAGRIYMILAIIGETALLSALLIASAQAGSLLIAEMRAASAGSPDRDVILLLMLVGFGIKAGLVPLHLWLPLAHPEAPTPASAVLSGAIVKAGVFGLIQFVPAGSGMESWSLGLVVAGLFGAYYGVVIGLTQSNPKVILAYSTVSQMSLVIAAVGAGLAAQDPAMVAALVALYAVHHGFAKGALFLSVSAISRATARGSALILGFVALVSLSVAGLPFTGGAAAKTALKSACDGPAGFAVTASAAGTTLVLLRFWWVLRAQAADAPPGRGDLRLGLPVVLCGAAALAVPWVLLPRAGLEPTYVAALPNLVSTGWPILLAAAIGLAGITLRVAPPPIPPGDLLAAFEGLARLPRPRMPRPRIPMRLRAIPVAATLARTERLLVEWSVAGALVLTFAMLALLLMS